jgi:hypothetical protein
MELLIAAFILCLFLCGGLFAAFKLTDKADDCREIDEYIYNHKTKHYEKSNR